MKKKEWQATMFGELEVESRDQMRPEAIVSLEVGKYRNFATATVESIF